MAEGFRPHFEAATRLQPSNASFQANLRRALEVNGGAELHCRWLAEWLAKRHHVEILATCAKDYVTWEMQMRLTLFRRWLIRWMISSRG